MNQRRSVLWIVVALVALAPMTVAAQSAARGPGFAPTQPQSYMVAIRSNVNGASVTIDGQYQGTAPMNTPLSAGTHTISVTADGYNAYNATVNVTQIMQVNANLQRAQFSLHIRSNVNGAAIFINGQRVGQAPYNTTLPAGSYELSVRASGYNEFSTTVQVNGSTSINANLHRSQYSLKITSNVNGAAIFINGQRVGQAPYTGTLAGGSYDLSVRAGGYENFSTTLNVNGPTNLHANLQRINYSLHITSNVHGAAVYVNGQRLGTAPYTATLTQGTYRVEVRAEGYQNFSTQVSLSKNSAIHAQLEHLVATVRVQIPDSFLNTNSEHGRGDRRRAQNDIQVFVDNNRINQDRFTVQQGNHTIRFESGSFMVQKTFHFDAGQNYVVSPELTITLKR